MSLIYYVQTLTGGAGREIRFRQLLASLGSLRYHNRSIPVRLILAGELQPAETYTLKRATDQLQLSLVHVGDYRRQLEKLWPDAHEVFDERSMLHKLALLETGLADIPAGPCLYVDSDTFFHRDPADLFTACSAADFYAREEPYSTRSPLGHRPEEIDEPALYGLQSAGRIQPFNAGVTLWSQDMIHQLMTLCPVYITYSLRFWLWLAEQLPEAGTYSPVANLRRSPQARAHCRRRGLTPLAYPARNPWICDQLALWCALSELPQLHQGWFSREQVLQGGEELLFPGQFRQPVLSHYFSTHTQAFFTTPAHRLYRTF